MPEWLRALDYLATGGAVPDNGAGPTPRDVWSFAVNFAFGGVVAGIIYYAVNSAMRNAGVSHHIAIGFGAALVYAILAVVYDIVNRTPPGGRF